MSPPSAYALLSALPQFRDLSRIMRWRLAHHSEVIPLKSGEFLFKNNSLHGVALILCHGKIRIFEHKPATFVRSYELTRGSSVSNINLPSPTQHHLSALAIRDCTLLRLPQALFQQALQRRPHYLKTIINDATKGALSSKNKQRLATTFCLVPAGNSCHLESFVRGFMDTLGEAQSILIREDSSKLKAALGEACDFWRCSQWMHQLETQYRFVVFWAGTSPTPWTQYCLRQADEILLIHCDGGDRQLNATEQFIAKHAYVNRHMIHVHPRHTTLPSHSLLWSNPRNPSSTHHVIVDQVAGYQRLLRYFTHQTQALVMGGGGARGFCHIGVYKALYECHMPIDCVGGTSAGAIMGALIAMGHDPQAIYDIALEHIVRNRRLFAYTLPIHSFRSGKQLGLTLQRIFGEQCCIEDLWLRFYCVSTSLTQMRHKMHRSGELWRQIRASISLPGVFPPISTPEKELLIDGAVTNNLPVDLMEAFSNYGQITSVKVSGPPKYASHSSPNGYVSLWNTLRDQWNTKRTMPTLPEVLIESIMLSGSNAIMPLNDHHVRQIDCNAQHVGPMNFKPLADLVDLGYRTAMACLEQEDKTGTHTRPSKPALLPQD